MRNLKKVLAVIMTVAMIASLMVPALAAGSNEDEAEALKTIGLFKGTNSGNALESTLTRDQGITLVVRILGKEDEALALSEEEISAELAKMADAAAIPGWARPYAAFALKEKITTGVGHNGVTSFDAATPLSGKLFTTLVLRALGYADVDYNNPWDTAVEAGVLTAGQTITLAKDSIIRDDAVAALYGAVKNGVLADGKTKLLDKLIADGAVDEDAAREAGFITEPEELKVESAEGLNLIQLKVVFNTKVDSETAENAKNYKVKGATVAYAKLQSDEKTVVITLKEAVKQQSKLDVEIEDVKDLKGNTMKDVTIEDVYFLDTEMPEVTDAQIVGIDTVKVTFSEPVRPDDKKSLKSAFEVKNADSDKLYVKSDNENATRYANDDKTAIYVVLSSDLDDEESINIKVNSDMEDFAGFSVMPNSTDIKVVVDDEAPVVEGYKDAKPSGVTLILDEDVRLIGTLDKTDFYHTNSKSPAEDVKFQNGNEIKLTFDEDSELPQGTAYVYINKGVIEDLWNNKNDQIMVKIEIDEDDTAPTLEKIELDSQNTIILTFSEDVTDVDRSDFTVYDDDEDEVSIKSVSVDGKKVTIVFRSDLSGDYAIAIEDIEDLVGNKISKTTEEFNAEDKTAPDLSKTDKVKITLYKAGTEDQMIKIDFGEKMATEGKYSVVDPENYTIKGSDLSDLNDVTIDSVDSGKGVEIYIPVDTDDDEPNPTLGAGDEIVISRVADAAGNYTKALSTKRALEDGATKYILIDKAELVATDKINVTLTDKLTDFEDDDFIINGAGDVSKVQLDENSDGNTVVVFTLEDDLKTGTGTADYDGVTIATETDVEEIESANVYGVKLKEGQHDVLVKDKVAPALKKVDDKVQALALDKDGNGYIDTVTIQYQEAIDSTFVNKYTYGIDDVTIKDIKVDTTSHDIIVIELDGTDEDIPQDTSWTPDVEQKFSIYDSANNNELKAADADIIETLDKAAPVVGTVKYGTDVDGENTIVAWDSLADNNDIVNIIVRDGTTYVAKLSATATKYTYTTSKIANLVLVAVDAAGNETPIPAK